MVCSELKINFCEMTMNKHAIAGAVLSIIGSVAYAQNAQQNTSQATIYGLVDAGIQYAGSALAGKEINKVALTSGQQNGSRLGFKGTEDLGSGLSAVYQLESGFDITNGKASTDSAKNTLLFGRQAFVGLVGGFGTLTLGRQYTAYDTVTGAIDPFKNGLSGNITNLFGKGYTVRADNAVRYLTPSFGGVAVAVTYGFGEKPGSNSEGRHIGLQATFNANNLYVGLAYQQDTSKLEVGETGSPNKRKDLVLGATYDLKVVKVHGAFGQSQPTSSAEKSKDVMLGLTVPFGSHAIFGSVAMTKAGEDKAQQLGLGYTYELSKRTNVYASAAKIKNSGKAALVVGGEGTLGAALGVRHTF